MSVLPRHVAVVSESKSVTPADLAPVAAALQKQVSRDFGPLWGVNGTVDSFPTLEDVPVDYWPVILRDNIKEPGAAGYHTDKHGQPFSLVQVDDGWSLTTGHEVLEMLADPFGNRIIAGSPPQQAPAHIKKLKRVQYLVEVCDPCEDDSNAYTVNGVTLSDFITPHYYDPTEETSVRYSFRGKIKSPHEVLNNGYVSFGDPISGDWYQIEVGNNQVKLVSLGKMNAKARSLREQIDSQVRHNRAGYRVQKAKVMAAAAGAGHVPGHDQKEAAQGRAKMLHEFINEL